MDSPRFTRPVGNNVCRRHHKNVSRYKFPLGAVALGSAETSHMVTRHLDKVGPSYEQRTTEAESCGLSGAPSLCLSSFLLSLLTVLTVDMNWHAHSGP